MTTERTFDRLQEFDEKSREFPIRTLLTTTTPVTKLWSGGSFLDQGSEGACVGFGWSAELSASPIRVAGITNDYARNLYYAARRVDQWPGEDYDGTSVLAGAKVAQARGKITSYRWCFSLSDLILTLSYQGPVVLGLNWYEGMWDTDSKGYIRPTGDMIGGHCVMARGVNVGYKRIRIRNSWGSDWGYYGDAYITYADMQRLLSEQGEACVPLGRKL